MRKPKAGLPASTLDDRDLRIIEALRRNAWLSYAELAKRIHLSASAVQRRVEKLIKSRVILGAHARISPAALGRTLRIFVLLELSDERAHTLAALVKKLAASEECTAAHYVTGAFDVLLELQMESMAEYARFAARTLNENPHVRRYTTLTELRSLC